MSASGNIRIVITVFFHKLSNASSLKGELPDNFNKHLEVYRKEWLIVKSQKCSLKSNCVQISSLAFMKQRQPWTSHYTVGASLFLSVKWTSAYVSSKTTVLK